MLVYEAPSLPACLDGGVCTSLLPSDSQHFGWHFVWLERWQVYGANWFPAQCLGKQYFKHRMWSEIMNLKSKLKVYFCCRFVFCGSCVLFSKKIYFEVKCPFISFVYGNIYILELSLERKRTKYIAENKINSSSSFPS